MAIPARIDDDGVRDFGRLLRKGREMGSFTDMGFLEERERLRDLGVLIMAIVAMVVNAIVLFMLKSFLPIF